jgi:hypothetical protein
MNGETNMKGRMIWTRNEWVHVYTYICMNECKCTIIFTLFFRNELKFNKWNVEMNAFWFKKNKGTNEAF